MTIFKPLLREVLVEFGILTKQLKATVDSTEFESVFDHQKLNSAMKFVNFENTLFEKSHFCPKIQF